MFKAGELVRCVNDEFDGSWDYVPDLPRMGRVYTVRACAPWTYTRQGSGETHSMASLLLEEVRNPVMPFKSEGASEPHFPACLFRPVRKPPIDALRRMLAPRCA